MFLSRFFKKKKHWKMPTSDGTLERISKMGGFLQSIQKYRNIDIWVPFPDKTKGSAKYFFQKITQEMVSKVRVFDYKAWMKDGGDAGDNDIFYKNATITKIYQKDGFIFIDIIWEKDGKESNGHFIEGIKFI